MHQYLLAAIEWIIMAVALYLLYPSLGWKGLLGLFFAFVGFELHLIWSTGTTAKPRLQKSSKTLKHLISPPLNISKKVSSSLPLRTTVLTG